MSRRSSVRASQQNSSTARARRRAELLRRATAAALPVRAFEPLEARQMLTLVQPAGQDYLAFEAEDAQATINDAADADGVTWQRINGAPGANSAPSAGSALISRDNDTTAANNDEGSVTYPIQLTNGGPYFMYVRTKFLGGGDNSMFVPADGGPVNADPTVQWDNRGDSIGDYHWNNLDVNGVAFDYTNPTPGAPTTLTFGIREPGYIIDKVVLSETAKTAAQLDAILGQTATAFTGPQPNQVTVRFTPVTGATGYNILRGTAAAGPFTQVGSRPIGNVGQTVLDFIDATLPAGSNGQTFYYTVQPVTAAGPGAQTAPAQVVLGTGVRGTYFNDAYWGGGGNSSVLRSAGGIVTFRASPLPDYQNIVPNIDFDWGTGTPVPGVIRGDFHTTIFSGKITIPTDADGDGTNGETIDVTFVNSSDDDGIIFVNGLEAANDMGPPGHGQQDRPGTPVSLVEGQSYNFSVWQAEQGGGSGVRMKWVNPASGATEVLPASMFNSAAMDVPTAPGLSAGTVTGTAAGETQRMVTFTVTDNSTSELWFELLRDGVVVGNAAQHSDDGDAGTPNTTVIADSQPLPGEHQYTVRAVNYDGASAASAAVSVTVPADYYGPATGSNGASAYYFNSADWNGGQLVIGGGGQDRRSPGMPDYGETVPTVDIDYGTTGNTPVSVDKNADFRIEDDYFSTVHTGEVLIPADFDGDATPGETINVQFVGNTDDHGIYFVNGQLAAISYIPRGQGDYTGAGPVSVVEGQRYDFTILQVEQGGGAGVHFKWVNPATSLAEVIPTDNLFNRQGAPSGTVTVPAPTATASLVVINFTENVTNEMRFEVERAEVTGGTPGAFSLVGYSGINQPQFLDRSALPGRSYRYRVTAVNYEGRGTPAVAAADISLAATEPVPNAPTNGSAQLVLNRANIQFTDNAFNEARYIIQRRLASAPESSFAAIPLSPVAGNATGVTGVFNIQDGDPALVPETNYVYRVIAENVNGLQSTPLDIVAAITPAFRTTLTNSQFPGGSFEIIRGDATMDNGWGAGRPDPGISIDTFHVWTEGTYTAPVAGDYIFATVSDDGERLFVDGVKVIDQWVLQGDTRVEAPPMTLAAGQKVELRFEMFELGGGATARLLVTPPGGTEQPVAASGVPDAAAALRAPIDVTATSTLGDTIVVHWLDTTANETGFEVLRGTDAAGPFTALPNGTVGKDGQYFFDNTGVAGTNYFYQVRALNGATQGPVSAATVDPITPVGTVGGAVNFANWDNPADQAQWTLTGPGVAVGNTGFVADDVELNSNDTEGQVVLRLVDNNTTGVGQTGAAYLTDPRHIDGFNASFDFSMSPGSGDPADGMTFVLQNDPRGLAALGGGGGNMGYVGIVNSFAVKFDNYPGQNNLIGIFHGGVDVGGGGNDPDGPNDPRTRRVPVGTFNLEAAQHFHVDMKYNNTTKNLQLTIDDIGNAATAAIVYNFPVDIPVMMGNASAYVGFTAATGGEDEEADIFNFSFTPNPAAEASISEVYVRGSTWSAAFKTYMEGQGLGDDVYGYRVDNKAATDVVPWINVDEIVLRFSGAPSGSGIPTPGTVVLDGVRSDLTVTTVTALDPQTYVLRLDRAMGNLPTPPGGENGDRIQLTVPGGGPAGAAYVRTINVLQGDTDKSGSVVAQDFSDVKKKFFRSTAAPGPAGDTQYTVFHDVDGSGSIVANDFSEVKKRFFDNLPAAPAGAAALFGDSSITKEVLG